MSITSIDDIVAALPGQHFPIWKEAPLSASAGRFVSSWKSAGLPGAGATPTTGNGELPTDATAGAIPLTNAGVGKSLYLASLALPCLTQSLVLLMDRLWQNSGLSGTDTGVQSFAAGDLTRYSDGLGNLFALEIYTAIGTTARTLTVNYTDEHDAAKAGSISLPASTNQVGNFLIGSLADGGHGVKKITSVQWSGSTGTAGDFGMVLFHPIAWFANTDVFAGIPKGWAELGLPVIANDACLALAVEHFSTSATRVFGDLAIIEV